MHMKWRSVNRVKLSFLWGERMTMFPEPEPLVSTFPLFVFWLSPFFQHAISCYFYCYEQTWSHTVWKVISLLMVQPGLSNAAFDSIESVAYKISLIASPHNSFYHASKKKHLQFLYSYWMFIKNKCYFSPFNILFYYFRGH